MEITFSRKSRQERAKLAFPAATFPRSCRKNNRPMAGLLAPGSSFAPRLPILLDSGIVAAVVPGYSSGTATASHRTSLAQRTKNDRAGVTSFRASDRAELWTVWTQWTKDTISAVFTGLPVHIVHNVHTVHKTTSMDRVLARSEFSETGWKYRLGLERILLKAEVIRFMPRPFREVIAHLNTRGQVFWLPGRSIRRAFPSPRMVAVCGFRRRLQQRVCDGFSPCFP